MHCWIYKGNKRPQTYLYLGTQETPERVPETLLHALGTLELVMELDLSTRKFLAKANPAQVMQSIQDRGYYLQLPPPQIPASWRVQ